MDQFGVICFTDVGMQLGDVKMNYALYISCIHISDAFSASDGWENHLRPHRRTGMALTANADAGCTIFAVRQSLQSKQ
jgi:hypothetical protein